MCVCVCGGCRCVVGVGGCVIGVGLAEWVTKQKRVSISSDIHTKYQYSRHFLVIITYFLLSKSVKKYGLCFSH